MDAQWVIQWYDWLLFLSGGKLYATSDLVFYANWTLKLLNALAYLLMMFGDSVAPSVFNYNETSVVQWLADKLNALLALAFSVTLTYYGGQVTELLEDCISAVDDAGRKMVREMAIILSAFCFVTVIGMAITGFVSDAKSVRESVSEKTMELVVGAVLSGFISLNSWFNNAMILYVIMVMTLVLREENQLNRMSATVTNPSKMDSSVVQQMLSQRKHQQRLVSEINRLFGFCPLYMFGFMLILTPAIITDVRENPDTVLLLFLALSFAAIIVLLAAAGRFFIRAEALSQNVIEQMYRLNDYDVKCQELVRELNVSTIKLSAWYMFDVTSKSFLSFTSAIFIFTVFYNQLNIKSLIGAEIVANSTKLT